ncbi:TRAP transporter small permease subunit [Pseudooceanicola sediminis]|uniref:TRAP transporter small permease protein n=1 Tax=Pseudooceanicola sediminis TaxID=2211117 RepID=A0A399J4F3_9RHOB|nr:TRAP transporter small permease subunit [Pseudooceanicola sediminis]KAA2315491.1 TRAP transporter small permease subunit [Puniceibacterium sp. HSS470]RII40303.1 TRAP transporter small permease subunit [Pseudooceanicola sediminis]|tara:strand:- start:114793 stop:115308 length:516 start_codon:yes stop_codon:yes gene_type:complete
MTRLFAIVDGISLVLSRIADGVAIVLVTSMIFEVVARYIFSAPTIWAFDISYMCTGTLFILGAAYALREDAHVRIDFLAEKLPPRLRRGIEGVVFFFLLMPIFAGLSWFAINRALRAWTTAEVEMVSPWAPLMWPFYSLLALGLVALTLQVAVQGLRAFVGQTRSSFDLEA